MNFSYETKNDIKAFKTEEYIENDVLYVKLFVEFADYIVPTPLKITWFEEIVDVAGIWAPSFKSNELRADWGKNIVESQLARYMPMFTLYSSSGKNRYTIALSDVKNLIFLGNGVVEENGLFENEIVLFNTPIKPIKEYNLLLKIDKRNVDYYQSIKECKGWWESLGNTACYIPNEAKNPIYSSWYNFHQRLDQNELLEEIKIASKLGFKTLIIDDGWQCDDNSRGYGYTGDWIVTPSKFYDLKKFVAECHKLDVKVMLWYSMPFVGYYSKNYEKFKGMYLYNMEGSTCSVLDPRFKDIREYLINLYKAAMTEYDLDGFKLDFIDAFYLYESSSKEYEKMDIPILEEAIDRLLKDIYIELSRVKNNVLIEYRQAYVGPLVTSYGNMFRVGDCPYSGNSNKREIINLRFTSANTPVHTDMIMWNRNNTLGDCYRQLYCSLFAVPQISVLLKNLPVEQYQLITNYLKYYEANKDNLLNGNFMASTPDNSYTWAKSSLNNKDIVVLYAVDSYKPDNINTDLFYLANNNVLYLDLLDGEYMVKVFDCLDNTILTQQVKSNILKLDILNCSKVSIYKKR